MATGYTYGVVDGTVTSVREFALGCSRAFGALIQFRDDNSNREILNIPLDHYHEEELLAAQQALDAYNALSKDEQRAIIFADHARQCKDRQAFRERVILENQRIDEMLFALSFGLRARPGEDLVGLWKFMTQQLEDSRNDLNAKCYQLLDTVLSEQDILDNLDARLNDLENSVKYHARKWRETKKDNEKANNWLRQLLDVLPLPKEPDATV